MCVCVCACVCRHERGDKDKEEVHLLVSSIMSVTNVAFFGLVGASLKLVRLHTHTHIRTHTHAHGAITCQSFFPVRAHKVAHWQPKLCALVQSVHDPALCVCVCVYSQSALKDMLVPALFIVAVRLVAIYTGSWLGCHFTQTQADHRRFFWASMVTQVR